MSRGVLSSFIHCIYPHLTHRHIHVLRLFLYLIISYVYFLTAPYTSPLYISASHPSSYPCHMSIFISHVFIFIPHRTLHHIHCPLHHSPQFLMFILIPFIIIISQFTLGLFLHFLFITPLCVDSLVCTFTVTVLSSFI